MDNDGGGLRWCAPPPSAARKNQGVTDNVSAAAAVAARRSHERAVYLLGSTQMNPAAVGDDSVTHSASSAPFLTENR